MHKQVMARANVRVDERLGALVEALSRVVELETLESCQDIDAILC